MIFFDDSNWEFSPTIVSNGRYLKFDISEMERYSTKKIQRIEINDYQNPACTLYEFTNDSNIDV